MLRPLVSVTKMLAAMLVTVKVMALDVLSKTILGVATGVACVGTGLTVAVAVGVIVADGTIGVDVLVGVEVFVAVGSEGS